MTVSLPTGAVEEVQWPLPLDNVAVQSAVDPVENETDPPGTGTPEAFVETVAEYVTAPPWVTALGAAPIDVCDGAWLTVSEVVPVELPNTASPEYIPEIVSVPTGAAAELQEPIPPDSGAVHSVVDPVENVTEPVGVGPAPTGVTVAE